MLTKAIFTSMLPNRTVINSLRGSSTNLAMAELLRRLFARILSTWPLVKADRAVSDPEKNEDNPIRIPRPMKWNRMSVTSIMLSSQWTQRKIRTEDENDNQIDEGAITEYGDLLTWLFGHFLYCSIIAHERQDNFFASAEASDEQTAIQLVDEGGGEDSTDEEASHE